MACDTHPAELRRILRTALKGGTALVEYYHTARDPVVARTLARTSLWLQQHGHPEVAVLCVDLAKDTELHLDRMGVKILPQPTTVAAYRQYGQHTQLWAGQATSASALVRAVL